MLFIAVFAQQYDMLPYVWRRTVFVGNLPDDLSDMELAEYFCELGQVLSAQIRGNDGAHFGFVEFAYPEHVQHVLSLADQQPFMMGDSYLRVQPRRAKEYRQVRFECKDCSLKREG